MKILLAIALTCFAVGCPRNARPPDADAVAVEMMRG